MHYDALYLLHVHTLFFVAHPMCVSHSHAFDLPSQKQPFRPLHSAVFPHSLIIHENSELLHPSAFERFVACVCILKHSVAIL